MKVAGIITFAIFLASIDGHAQQNASSDSAGNVRPAIAEATAPEQISNSSYTIGPSDVLNVTVWREATLSGQILVRPDGMISMALLGDVKASGLTPLQLAGDISTGLKKYYQDPKVTVVVAQIHSKLVFLIGEINRKGPVEMTSNMTLLEAISSAGGLTDFANRKKIYVLRTQDKGQIRIPVHYKEALKGDSNFNLVLRPGDTIVVP